jgi:hypothetical protein
MWAPPATPEKTTASIPERVPHRNARSACWVCVRALTGPIPVSVKTTS